jgi:TonB family protein
MKRTKLILIWLILFGAINLNSQTTQDDQMASNETEKPEILLIDNSLNELNFTELYEININTPTKAKTLGDAVMRKEPVITSEQLELIIPQGAIVETFKYFPREATWAVKYNNTWGFVAATMIMPVMEKAPVSNVTPYDEAPKRISDLKVEYPESAQKQGIQGKVVIKVLISKSGEVTETEIVSSIPELDAYAIAAVKKLKFKPGKYKGKPVDVWVRIPINFEIENF